MKEINLLPKDKRFSYKQYLLKKISVGLLISNLVVLVVVYVFNVYFNKTLKRCVTNRKTTLDKISSIEAQLVSYENRYRSLLKKLSKLEKEEKRLKSIVFVRRSAFASTVVSLNAFTSGIGFESISYSDGYFKIKGLANSMVDFQRFYYSLERNRFVRNLRMFSVKKKKDLFEFTISYRVEY